MHLQSNHSRMFKKRMVFMVIAAWGCQLLAGPVWAAPQGGVVTSGAATISQSGNVTAINQATQKTAINWQSFGTKPQETVNFHQPNASAIAVVPFSTSRTSCPDTPDLSMWTATRTR